MKTGWTQVTFSDACTDVSSLAGKVPKSEWRHRGDLPIIDQGDSTVAGYTDDTALKFRGELPVIVFGDHTRRIKFVDDVFAVGADGVKILQPSSRFDPRFLYWFLVSREIPSAGYSRHFKFLKETRVPLPPRDEQRRIASVLDAAGALGSKRRRALAVAGVLVQSLFAEMFGRSDQTAITPLAEIIASNRPVTYGILKPGPDVPDGVPYVRVIDIEDSGIRTDAVRRTTDAIAREYRRSTLTAGDLVMSIRGHVGRLAVVPPELDGANITQDSARLAVSGYDPRFVVEAIRSPAVQSWMRKRIKGAAVQGINLADVKLIPIPRAPIAAQRDFGQRAAACDRLLARARQQLRHCDALFASLQYRAFAGEL